MKVGDKVIIKYRINKNSTVETTGTLTGYDTHNLSVDGLRISWDSMLYLYILEVE